MVRNEAARLGQPAPHDREQANPPPSTARHATATIAEAIRDAAVRLRSIADNPRLEARLLLSHALDLTHSELLRDTARRIDLTRFDSLLTRREAHEPVALILGHQEFWSMDFQVSRATLIPRADSETLIQAALTRFAGQPNPARILDLGTGTGCLLLALLKEFPTAFGIGIDIAPAAARLARTNAARLDLSHQAAFVCGDWTHPLTGGFDLIIANPPYITAADIATLMPEVADYEPRTALDGGGDGYDAYRSILPQLARLLTTRGAAILELGFGQAETVTALARENGFRCSLHLDLAGIERAISLDRAPR
jgi:release factor glutamine methyltransferase